MWWIATFCVLLWLDFSINILTLLALVLAIGLVVDDAIVVLENVHRRMVEYGETRLVAAFRGTRQVGFAVVATSVVLIAVFVPIAFLQGSLGRLFSEFALTMAAAVGFSTLVALTLSPMMASRILPQGHRPGPLSRAVDHAFGRLCRVYLASLNLVLHHRWVMVLVFLGTMGSAVWLYREVPQEYTPKEDRGTFNILVDGPEGASFSYMREYLDEIERRLMPYIERGEALRLQVRAPRSFTAQIFNSGQATLVLNDYDRRRSAWAIMEEVRQSLADLPGIRTTPVMRRGFGSRTQKPVQFVLGGGTYAELAQWRDRLLAEIDQSNPRLSGIDWDYKETKPQLRVAIDYERAADLGVKVGTIGRTLETMLGSRRVTTYLDAGEEYDVILEGERDAQRTPASLDNLYVRSERSKALIPLANLVKVSELADSKSLNRFDRLRAITIEANLAEGLALGEALGYLEGLVHQHLPDQVQIGYKGQSKDFQQASGDILFVFALGLVVVFLVLAAQFESWVHPFVIMLTVPLAMSGALFGLWITGETLNIYSQIGLVMLVGLAAKNGILIVEFANQLRDQGLGFRDALLEASRVRLRPILMTSFTAAAGSVPLLLSAGPGAEARGVIGTVILFGVLAATAFTLFVVPVAYDLIARRTASPGAVTRQLEQECTISPPIS